MRKGKSLIERSREIRKQKEEMFRMIANDYHKELNRLLALDDADYTYDEDYESKRLNFLFGRHEDPSSLSYDEILEALENKAYNHYRMRGNIEGMVLLGRDREESREDIRQYQANKVKECDTFFRKNIKNIEFWKQMLEFRYATVEQDSEGTKGELESINFFDNVAKDKKGYIPFITTPNFIYTKQFYNFIMQNWDKLSISACRRAMSVVRQFNRNHRLKMATILQHIVGKRKACTILGLGYHSEVLQLSKVVESVLNPLIYPLIRRNSTKMTTPDEKVLPSKDQMSSFNDWYRPSFRTDYKDMIKDPEMQYSRREAQKIRQEMKKLIYQNYIYEILPYYKDAALDELVDYKFLEDMEVTGNYIDLLGEVDKQEELATELREEYEHYTNGGRI